MRQRLAEIGGHCEIKSAPGKGTKVTFTVALKGLSA
jgi:signal transduction histidine kinase